MSWTPPFDERYDGMIVVMEVRYVLKSERAEVVNKLRGPERLLVARAPGYLTLD